VGLRISQRWNLICHRLSNPGNFGVIQILQEPPVCHGP
jgi:hypothetical protein